VRWSGEGADREWVDVEELRGQWRAGVFDAGTAGLLQAGWLAREGIA
jgi:hypothetical protein